MTSLERRGNAIAFAFTAFFFLAFLIFSLAVKFKPQEKFQVLTINLASFPVEKKIFAGNYFAEKRCSFKKSKF